MRTNRMLVPLVVVLIPLLLSAALAQGPPPPPPLTPLPPPPSPAGNPVTVAKANLGKTLFWDEQLSSARTVACGSCHQASVGGSDPRSQVGAARSTNPGPDGVVGTPDDIVGSPGVQLCKSDGSLVWSGTYGIHEQVTGRHAPSFVNAAYAPALFWDGRATGTFVDPVTGTTVLANGGALESQAAGPPASSTEMGHEGRGWNDVAARVASVTPLALSSGVPAALSSWIEGRGYADLFAEAFGSSEVTAARILLAIATYERTLFSTQAPFDSVIAGTATLAPNEAAGMQLFGQLNCARCHGGALTSDNRFHYIGESPAAEDSGRMIVTHDLQDLGAMKTPILRNVALRPAYMHDGRFASLAQVVDFYDRGGDFAAPNKDPLIVPLHLSPLQKAQLLAFLGRPLTDPRVAEGAVPFDRPNLFSEGAFVPRVLAGGVPGVTGAPPVPVALEPPITGNPAFTVGVYGGPSGARAVLVIDDQEPPVDTGIPDAYDFARIETTLDSDGATGYGSVTLAIPDDSSLAGRIYYGRWYVEDAAAPGGIAASPAFRFQLFGPNGAGLPLAVGGGDATSGVRIQAGVPNPFRFGTTIRYELPTTSRARLAVYDVTGRLRRRLVDRASAAPGTYTVAWDGRDEGGRDVPAGVYFYRLDTDRASRTTRVVRVH